MILIEAAIALFILGMQVYILKATSRMIDRFNMAYMELYAALKARIERLERGPDIS